MIFPLIVLVLFILIQLAYKEEHKSMRPAIVAVGYNRPEGMRRLLESIGNAQYMVSDIPLIISIDESNLSDEVEKVAREFNWKYGAKEIRRFPERQGLRRHIIQCGDYSEKYGAVIILEDDLVVAEDFYEYTCRAHEKYEKDERICGVSLYSYNINVFTRFMFCPARSVYDVYLGDMVVTWGQSWTSDQWKKFKEWYFEHEDKLPTTNPNMPQKISTWTRSWGRYFASYIVDKGLSYIYPYQSRTTCFSDYGEHNKSVVPITFVQVPLMQGLPSKYKFGEFQELVHYDSFFERVLDKRHTICGISGENICLDTNNMKTIAGKKKYVVTNEILPHKLIASFGLTLRPICMNVIQEVPGEELYLYQLNGDQIRPYKNEKIQYCTNRRRLRYEHFDMPWRTALIYALKEFFSRIKESL